MDTRFSQINLQILKDLTKRTVEKFHDPENREYFLIMGNPGLRSGSKRNKIAYLKGDEPEIQTSSTQTGRALLHPELYKIANGVMVCECPDFSYEGKKEAKICQAISLEIAGRMANKIQGLIISINYNDLIAARGSAYKDLISQLSVLFNSAFEAILKSSVFLVMNKPKDINKDDFIETLHSFTSSDDIEQLESNLKDCDPNDDLFEEQDKLLKQEKNQLTLSQFIGLNKNRLVMLDEADKGESREMLLKALSETLPINISKFNFDKHYSESLKPLNFNIRKFVDDTIHNAPNINEVYFNNEKQEVSKEGVVEETNFKLTQKGPALFSGIGNNPAIVDKAVNVHTRFQGSQLVGSSVEEIKAMVKIMKSP